jgi:hypothetical protein
MICRTKVINFYSMKKKKKKLNNENGGPSKFT